MSNLLDYSQKLKPGDTISNIANGKNATVVRVYPAGIDFTHGNVDDAQFLKHDIINLYWRWER